MRDDLDHLLVGPPRVAHRLHVLRAHVAALVHEGEREAQQRLDARVGRGAVLRGGEVVARDAGLAPERGVGGEAVLARVPVRDGDGDLLADGRAERAGAEGAERTPHALQGGGRVRDRPEHRRDAAERGTDLVEPVGDGAGGGLGADEGTRDTGISSGCGDAGPGGADVVQPGRSRRTTGNESSSERVRSSGILG